MAGIEVSSTVYLASTDLGICATRMSQVRGYDVEDIVRDKAVSQARAVQLLYLGKRIRPNMPTTPRTIKTVWRDNQRELV